MGAGLSIRSRLIVVIGAILVIGFLTTNILSFRVSSATLKETILHNELPLTSSNIYSEIQADLLRPIFVSSLMSNDTFLKDWLLGGEVEVEQIRRYLDEIRRKYGVFTSFVISEKTRNYYHFSGIAQVVDENDPEDVWYFRARAMDKPYEVNIDFNQAQGNTITIFVNYRLLDYDGRFIGVAGVGLAVESVARIVDRYGADYQRNIFFVDADGRITVRSGHAAIPGDNIRTAPGLRDIAEQILSKEQGFFEYNRDGQTMLVTTRNIPELGWHVVVEQNEAEAFRNLWRGFVTNLAIGAVIVAATIATIAYAVNWYQRRLEDMATTDKLTGIGNRQMFDLSMSHAIKMQRRSPRPLSVIIFDIDFFKQVNDSLGHLKGDQVIRRVAEATARQVRESDLLCRWGGEEFIILAHDCTQANAVEIAEKLRRAIARQPLFDPDGGERVTISAGVAEYREGDDEDTLIGRADAGLYRAKEEGRNRVCWVDAEARPACVPA